MADYNANIKVNADTRAAEQSIKRLTNELDRLKGVKNIGEAFVPQKTLTRLEKGLTTVVNRANTVEKAFARVVEGVGTLGVSGAALSGLNEALKGIATATGQSAANFSGAARKIDEFSAAGDNLRTTLAQVNNLLVDAGHEIARAVVPGFAAMDDTAQATARTANKLQYALQQFLDSTEGIRTFVNNIGTIEGTAGAATVALTALAAVVEGQLSEALYDIDVNASTALKQLATDASEGASELQRLIRATQGTVEQYEALIAKGQERIRTVNAESDEARRAANTITQGQKLLNEELERQNDLLREARGLTQTSLEERKGVKSIQTSKNREEYLSNLSNDVNAALQAAAELDQELLNLDQHLQDIDTATAERRWRALTEQWDEAEKKAKAAADRLDELRRKEAAASEAARGGPLKAFDTGGVQRRTIAGVAYPTGAAPGGARDMGSSSGAYPYWNPAVSEALAGALKNEENRAKVASQITFSYQLQQTLAQRLVEATLSVTQAAERELNTQQNIERVLKRIRNQKRQQRVQELKERKARAKALPENIALGVGFPLLFGGGAGSVLGSLAGSFVGKGFGGQILGGAIGQALDQFAQATAEMGNALRDPIEGFQKISEKGLLASKSQEKYVQKLIEAGRTTEAATIIQDELIKKIGVQGVKDLQNAGTASEELNKTMAELTLQVQAAVAGPLNEFLGFINTLASSLADLNRQQAELRDFGAALTEADPEAFKKYLEESTALAQKTGGVVDPAAVKQLQQKYINQYNLTPGQLPATTDPTAAEKAAGRTNELQSQVDLAQKQLVLADLTLDKDGQAYVQAAQAVALQEKNNALLVIENSKIGTAISQKDIKLQQDKAELAYKLRLLQLEQQITQDAEARRKAQVSAFNSLSQEYQKTLDLQVKEVTVTQGRLAGIKKQQELFENVTDQMFYQLDLEQRTAVEEARRTGTVLQTLQLYKQKYENMEKARDIAKDELKGQEQLLVIEKELARARAKADAARPFEELKQSIEAQNQAAKTYLRLVMEGIIPSEAERLVQFEQLVNEQLKGVDEQIRLTKEALKTAEAAVITSEAYGAAAEKVKELKDQLAQLQAQRSEITSKATEGPGNISTQGQQLDAFIAKARGELNDLEALAVRVSDGIATAIGNSMAQGIAGLIEGTQTAQEVFANFLKNVSNVLIQEGTKMIAMYIAIAIAKAFAGLSGSSSKTEAPDISGFGAYQISDQPLTVNDFPKYASGGYVTKPTNALIGEGGEPEYVIPASKMSGAMARYSSGQRGSSVINGAATAGGGGGSQVIRFESTVINNVEYVTRSQAEAMSRQAAKQGAAGGYAKTMGGLRNSRATRARVGMG